MAGAPLAKVKKDFGASVRAHRLRLGLSQERLAERAGLHRTYVTDVERGARNISLESISRLAGALELPVSSLFAAPGPADRLARHAGTAQAHILLVEDDPREAADAMQALREARLANQVELVNNGAAALDYLFYEGAFARRKRLPGPLVVLLDLGLPRMHGLEVLKRVRADARTRMVRVVALIGPPPDNEHHSALRLGADACLRKPLDFQALSSITPQLNFSWFLLHPPNDSARKNTGLRS